MELIDDNAGELARCVEVYITLWGLPQEFRQWNQRENFYCNTLVDRIVSGYPREEETRHHLENLVGQEDSLLAVGEPFGLWVIERKGDIAQYIPSRGPTKSTWCWQRTSPITSGGRCGC